MDAQREKFLNLKTSPARLNVQEAAWYLGFAQHDIPVLVSHGLLKPLGHPSDHSMKFFALVTLDELKGDPKWLARATDAMLQHWRGKNRKQTKGFTRPKSAVTVSQESDPVIAVCGNGDP